MKNILLFLLCLLPAIGMGQGHKGAVKACAPMKNGKVCYSDEVEMKNTTQMELFNAINKWAVKTYGRDIFLSNLSSNKNNGTILISSKIEMLLEDVDKTQIKFKMRINCYPNKYTAEISDIVYQYDVDGTKRYKTYPAESVIANNGKSNTIAAIHDPVLFCNATFFFMENLLGDVFEAAKGAE